MILQFNKIQFLLNPLINISLFCRLIKYNEDGYARIGIMPRYGDANSIKWFEVEPCYVFHLINCFEDYDEVIVFFKKINLI